VRSVLQYTLTKSSNSLSAYGMEMRYGDFVLSSKVKSAFHRMLAV